MGAGGRTQSGGSEVHVGDSRQGGRAGEDQGPALAVRMKPHARGWVHRLRGSNRLDTRLAPNPGAGAVSGVPISNSSRVALWHHWRGSTGLHLGRLWVILHRNRGVWRQDALPAPCGRAGAWQSRPFAHTSQVRSPSIAQPSRATLCPELALFKGGNSDKADNPERPAWGIWVRWR